MRGFVGIGQSDNLEVAIEEATTGLKNADLLILLSPFQKAEMAASLLHEKYPAIPMIGTVGATLAKGITADNNIIVIGFAGVTVTTGLISNVTKAPYASIAELEQNMKAIDANPANTICMEFVTEQEQKVVSTINSVLHKNNIPLAGGSSYGVPLGDQPVVIYNGRLHKKSCVYAFIRNNAGKIHLFKEDIYKRMHKLPHYATLVDTNTKTLFQLDDTPAFELYSEAVGCEREQIVANMASNPLGRAIGDETYIIATDSLDVNGVMFNGKAIAENDSIYFMEADDFQSIHTDTIAKIQKTAKRVSFVFALESVNRLKLFASNDYYAEYLESYNEFSSFAGLVGTGEQYNSQHVNQTLVLVVFE